MRSLIMAGRVIRQIVKDRRTLALLFVAPVLVIFLMYTVFNVNNGMPRVQAVNLPADLQSAIAQEAEVTTASSLSDALVQLKDLDTDAVITYDDPTVTVYVEGSSTDTTASVKKALSSAVSVYAKDHAQQAARDQMQAKAQKIGQQVQEQIKKLLKNAGVPTGSVPEITVDLPDADIAFAMTDVSFRTLDGSEELTVFDTIAPLMMGFFIFFFVFILAGVAFLRERVSGTLERLLATPIRRYEIVLGYFLGFGVFVFLQTLLIQVFMVNVLHIALKGNFGLVLLINLLLAAGSLALGTLLSAFARNELQMFQFIPLVIVPQILFCGLFSLRDAPAWVVILSRIFPLTYAAHALTDVSLRGLGLTAILPDLAILFGYMTLFLVLNTLVLKKYRRI